MKAFVYSLAALLSTQALAIEGRGKLVEIIRATPIFEQPQRNAKVVADADAGSQFTVLQLSPKKTWVQLMDEDGNKGWVPTQRSNYFILEAPVVDATKESQKKVETKKSPSPPRDPLKEMEAEKKPKKQSYAFRDAKVFFSASLRKGFKEPHGAWGVGPKVYINAPLAFTGLRAEKSGLEAAYYHMTGQKKSEPKGYSIPLRYKLMSQEAQSNFISGIDVGAMFMRIRPISNAAFWKTNISLGYSIGYCPRGSSFAAWLRPGGEFLYHSHFSLEGNIAWLF